MAKVKDGDIRICIICKEPFIFHKGHNFGKCCSKECYRQYSKEYHAAHRDERRQYSKEYCAAHRDELRQYSKEYRASLYKYDLSQRIWKLIRSIFRVSGHHHINLLGFDNRPENLQPFKDKYEHMSVFHRYINDNHPEIKERSDLLKKGLTSLLTGEYRHLIPTASKGSEERLKQTKKLREFCLDYLEKFKAEHPHDVDVNPRNYLPKEYRNEKS